MKHEAVPVRNAWFRDLMGRCPGTAAESLPLVLWYDVVDGPQPTHAHRHHDFFSLYIVQRGRGTHVIEGVPYEVSRGDVYVMGPGMAHHYTRGDRLLLDTLHFAPGIFDGPTRDALTETLGFRSLFVEGPLHRAAGDGIGGRWLHLTPDAYVPIAATLAELRAEWGAGTPGGTLLTRGLFVRLLVHLARRHAEGQERGLRAARPPDAHEATVTAAVRYLDERFHEPLRIEEVAARVFLSPDRFTEVFAAAMGRTPRDYLRHLRVERAKSLLTATCLPISEVAQRSGFGESAYFTRVFRAATGTTPRDYRQSASGGPRH